MQNIEFDFDDEGIDIDTITIDDDNNFFPVISKSQDKYFVSACYWSAWSGLVRELVEITIRDNRVENIYDASSKVEYEYDCGIRF